MHPAVVADPGGLLVLAGLLEGVVHDADEILSLDAGSLLVAEYLALRHEGTPPRALAEFAVVQRVVSEWFPVRGLAIDAALDASDGIDVDGVAALGLAHSLAVPLVTKNRDLISRIVPVLYC